MRRISRRARAQAARCNGPGSPLSDEGGEGFGSVLRKGVILALRPARSRREPQAPAPLGTLRFPGALAWLRAPPLPQPKPGPGRGGAAVSRRWVPVPAIHRLRARVRRGTALAPAPAYGPSPGFNTVARGSRGRQGDPQDRAPSRPRRLAGQSSPMAGECPRLPTLDPSAAPGPFGHFPPHRWLALGRSPCPTPGSERGVLENEAGSSQRAAGQEVWRSRLLTTPPGPEPRTQSPEPASPAPPCYTKEAVLCPAGAAGGCVGLSLRPLSEGAG